MSVDFRSLAALAPPSDFPAPPGSAIFPRIGIAPVDPKITEAGEFICRGSGGGRRQVELIEAPFDLEAIGVAWGTIASAGLAWHLTADAARSELAWAPNAAAMAANGARLRDF